MSDLSEAIKMAVDAHYGQYDKNNEPYILHPLRVMLAQQSNESRIAAVLHDVVEDGAVGHGDILALFGETVHDAVFALTRQVGEDYFCYVKRAQADAIAREVKIADLSDNLLPSRSTGDDAQSSNRRAKYQRALSLLKETV